MENLEDIIFKLENKLQQPGIRKSVEQLEELISDDLIEFGSSGQIYTKKDVLNNLPVSPEIKFIMTDFRIKILSSDIIQSLFKTEKINQQTGITTHSVRSSLWRNEKGKWKMLFHQGIPLKEI